jgi:hypothetical protein
MKIKVNNIDIDTRQRQAAQQNKSAVEGKSS